MLRELIVECVVIPIEITTSVAVSVASLCIYCVGYTALGVVNCYNGKK